MNRLAMWIVFLATAAGGCSGGHGDPVSFLWFDVSQDSRGNLQVYVDSSFAYLVDPHCGSGSGFVQLDASPPLPECPDSGIDSGGTTEADMIKRGHLDETTVSALRGYFADEKIRHYVEGYQHYTEDCSQHGMVIFWGRRGISACWYPAEVSDPETSAMLEYVGSLFESVANGWCPYVPRGC